MLLGGGCQNRLPQNLPFWHVDYFEVKALETLWHREKFLSFSYPHSRLYVEGLSQNKGY